MCKIFKSFNLLNSSRFTLLLKPVPKTGILRIPTSGAIVGSVRHGPARAFTDNHKFALTVTCGLIYHCLPVSQKWINHSRFALMIYSL